MTADEAARELYDRSVVIDGLNVSNWSSPAVYQSLHRGGVTAVNATIAVWEGYRETMDNIAAWLRRFREHADILTQVKTVQDIHRAKKEGRAGIILGFQNASPIENDLARLELFHALGVRIIQLTYNERNLLGDGSRERVDGGLSNFGMDAVKEMNRLGILVDLSHVGDRSTLEAAELSTKPVACTHTNSRSFFNHVRSQADEALKLVAQKGGVVGANALPPMLPKGFQSTLQDYVDAIDYLVELIGIDHVGIGTDFTQDQSKAFFDWLYSQQGTKYRPRPQPYPDPVVHPRGLETPDKLSNVAVELMRRGYGEDDAAKVLGGNWLRLFGQVWAE